VLPQISAPKDDWYLWTEVTVDLEEIIITLSRITENMNTYVPNSLMKPLHAEVRELRRLSQDIQHARETRNILKLLEIRNLVKEISSLLSTVSTEHHCLNRFTDSTMLSCLLNRLLHHLTNTLSKVLGIEDFSITSFVGSDLSTISFDQLEGTNKFIVLFPLYSIRSTQHIAQLYHELGHILLYLFIRRRISSVDELVNPLSEYVNRGMNFIEPPNRRLIVNRWVTELLADIIASILIGPPFFLTLVGSWGLDHVAFECAYIKHEIKRDKERALAFARHPPLDFRSKVCYDVLANLYDKNLAKKLFDNSITVTKLIKEFVDREYESCMLTDIYLTTDSILDAIITVLRDYRILPRDQVLKDLEPYNSFIYFLWNERIERYNKHDSVSLDSQNKKIASLLSRSTIERGCTGNGCC